MSQPKPAIIPLANVLANMYRQGSPEQKQRLKAELEKIRDILNRNHR
jgi:hypothetical protein